MVSTFFGFFTILVFSIIYFANTDFLENFDQKKLNSFIAGFGIVYVIIYMLPQLPHGHELLENTFGSESVLGQSSTIYIITLIGASFFYLLDFFLSFNTEYQNENKAKQVEKYDYWMHLVFFGLYNVLIGMVVGFNGLDTMFQQFIYLIAYFIHFLAIKWGVFNLDKERYLKRTRYIFIALLFVGYFMPIVLHVPEYILGVFEAFIAGGMILLVFNHEVPEKEDSNNLFLVIGIIIATLLFLVIV